MNRAEWMNECLIWSRGRLISPSLPVGDDRYLNLSSQKRPTGRNLGGNRLVRRSGTTSRGTVVLVFYLRMRTLLGTYVLTRFEKPTSIRYYLTIRPVARKGYGAIAHEPMPNGLLIRGP